MRVYNIEWDVDAEDICEYFGECSSEKAAELLGITAEAYDAMADDETTKIIMAFARANPKKIWELFNLPEEIEVCGDMTEDEVSDYITDTFNFCHAGFSLSA